MQLFPDPPRRYPGQRGVKIVARAIHVLCAGVFTASYVFDVGHELRSPWLWATVASGAVLLALDLYESFAFLVQIRGLVVLTKLTALVCLTALHPYEAWVLGAVVLLSVVSSHAPSSVRYRLVVGRGRIQGATNKG